MSYEDVMYRNAQLQQSLKRAEQQYHALEQASETHRREAEAIRKDFDRNMSTFAKLWAIIRTVRPVEAMVEHITDIVQELVDELRTLRGIKAAYSVVIDERDKTIAALKVQIDNQADAITQLKWKSGNPKAELEANYKHLTDALQITSLKKEVKEKDDIMDKMKSSISEACAYLPLVAAHIKRLESEMAHRGSGASPEGVFVVRYGPHGAKLTNIEGRAAPGDY